jgi:hypothetical protein
MLTPEMKDILFKLADLQRDFDAAEVPPKWKTWERGPWELDRDWGFRWQPSLWFAVKNGTLMGAAGKRFQRAATESHLNKAIQFSWESLF